MWRSYTSPFKAYPLDRLRGELAANPPRFSFVVLGNTELSSKDSPGKDGTTVYGRIMELVRSIYPQPGFVFHLGDVAERPGDTGAWDRLVRSSAPYEVGPVRGACFAPGEKKCFVLPGERDVVDRETEREFMERFFGPCEGLPFSFDWEEFHFIALNSEMTDDSWLMTYFGYNRQKNRIAGAQFRWLEVDLERNSGRKIVVFIHKPMFPPVFSSHEGYCLDQYYTDREKLLDLLGRYSVRAVFMGHEPLFHWTSIENTAHIITGGAGGRPKSRRRLGGFYHFLYVTIDEGSGMKVYCVDPERHTVEGKIDIP